VATNEVYRIASWLIAYTDKSCNQTCRPPWLNVLYYNVSCIYSGWHPDICTASHIDV